MACITKSTWSDIMEWSSDLSDLCPSLYNMCMQYSFMDVSDMSAKDGQEQKHT